MTQNNFATAINEALHEAMQQDNSVICYGLGVTDPKAVFGTTSNLEQRFGSERVFDMPTSENAMTGVAIGAALNGIKSVMTHQRFDFFLLAMDQLINGAAKWHYMFGGQNSIPITIRLIIGVVIRLPQFFILCVRNRTVAKTDSIGLVVLMCCHVSAG